MKTKWGSCNPTSHAIRLNTDLAKKPPECLEYIVVHELTHLIEPSHNARFVLVMNLFMPKWQHYRDELNYLPVRHEHWEYEQGRINRSALEVQNYPITPYNSQCVMAYQMAYQTSCKTKKPK